ncbi:hypothetical protein BHE74_00023119 [Ensete ventricosum]|nr:hypothetical protein BHE74_00023119 [Ensete ventricosum]
MIRAIQPLTLVVQPSPTAGIPRRRWYNYRAQTKTRRCLVPAREDEAAPCPHAGRRGDVLYPNGKMRHHVVLLLEDEASPHSRVRRRGVTSFPREETHNTAR